MLAMAVAILLTLAACAATPGAPGRTATRRPPPPPPTAQPAPESARPPVSTQVYVFPARGQSADRMGQDRYECYLWAVKQTGFDPSQTLLAPHQRVEVVPMPPKGADTVAGAVTGAIVGAVIARDPGAGAVGGAILGGAAGAVSDAQREAAVKHIQRRYDREEADRMARLEAQASDYRRALTACLEGRGYTVE
jgi:hypothetical protein